MHVRDFHRSVDAAASAVALALVCSTKELRVGSVASIRSKQACSSSVGVHVLLLWYKKPP
jgi:hypothetical protein